MTGDAEVVVVAAFRARPGEEAAVERALLQLVPPTHGEAGCIAFAVHRGADDPRRLVAVERWRDRAALDAHLATPWVGDYRRAVEGRLSEPPRVDVLHALPAGDPAKGTLAG